MTYKQLCHKLETAPTAEDRKKLVGEYSTLITNYFARWRPGVVDPEDWASEILHLHLQMCETYASGSFYRYAYGGVINRANHCLRQYYAEGGNDEVSWDETPKLFYTPDYVHRMWCFSLAKQLKAMCSDVEWRCINLLSEGYTHKEISEITGLTVKSVGNAIDRARAKARRLDDDEL